MNLYSIIMSGRNYLYDKNWLKVKKLNCPVVAVGNITVGGTGKTAIVDHLLLQLKAQNIKVGVVSRGYKGQYKNTSEVLLSMPQPSREFGDEVSMLKWKHTDVPIFVSKKRYEAGRALLKKYPDTQLILADDAYQHRSLYRDLNLCLIDVTESPSALRVLPFGRLREPFEPALKRADIVLMTKANLSLNEITDHWLTALSKLQFHGPVYKVHFNNKKFIHLASQQIKTSLEGSALVFCGLARPENFALSLKNNSALDVVEALAFKDHMSYNKKHIQSLMALKKQVGADFFITTAKDAIKLIHEKDLAEQTWVADLDLEILGVKNHEADFIKEIIRLVRT